AKPVLPPEFFAFTTIRYTRPLPPPWRSARSRNDAFPRSFASGESPLPGEGWSSSFEYTSTCSVGEQLPVALADSPTLIRSLFGGHSKLVPTEALAAGVPGVTVTFNVPSAEAPPLSVTRSVQAALDAVQD